LSPHAECVYTQFMRLSLLLVVFGSLFPSICTAAESSPRELLTALNALAIDSQHVYTVSTKDRVELRKADTVLAFQDGKIAFFQSFDGHITGFVFSGIGHVVALPRDPVEKQQIARFFGVPVLDEQFLSAYVRFTDGTGEDLLRELQRAELAPAVDEKFAALWRDSLERLNPSHSLRILVEKYSNPPAPFFHAGLDGVVTGPLDILLDDMQSQNFSLGQPRTVGKATYYDMWSSFQTPGTTPFSMGIDAIHYRIDTTIHPDNSLEASASIEFRAAPVSQQFLAVQLSRALKITAVTADGGEALPFFQNEGLTQQEINSRGQDSLIVFLPKRTAPGREFTLHFRYSGNVIEDAGNSVLFVGARESWYPHYGDSSEFALYDLTFRWPKRLRLVATGTKSAEREEGDWRTATWKTEIPVPEAGFNLGEYASSSVTSESRSIDVYANKQLEEILRSRLSAPAIPDDASRHNPLYRPKLGDDMPSLPPSPATFLRQLAREIDSSIHFYELYSGPFPFRTLGVSQIPGTFGQGWPGLLYVSTYSFLTDEAQHRAGLTSTGREFFTDLVPFHEVAHQWWGNVVGWSSYRDQWIDEAISEYLALLFADSQKNPDHTLNNWLTRYRKRLITKAEGEDRAPADIGPVIIGRRLISSRSPDAYNVVVYAKGAWIMHMLREMLRQPSATGGKDPDARFIALLHTLVSKYARKELTTADLQREVEAVMTPRMDLEGGRSMEWFFDEYVRGTGIPHYKVQFTSRSSEKGFQIRGKLIQGGVPHSFIAPVPIYAATSLGRAIFLGTVVATGEETNFTFTSAAQPHKLLIDPHMTLLCVTE
jgi:Peptidase family M1 domain